MLALIVDDELLIATDIAVVLEGLGLRTAMAASAVDAFAIVEAESPALAVVDLQLSDGATGEGVARQLLAQEIPVIVASGSDSAREACRRLPAARYLDKPFDQRELKAMVGQLVGALR